MTALMDEIKQPLAQSLLALKSPLINAVHTLQTPLQQALNHLAAYTEARTNPKVIWFDDKPSQRLVIVQPALKTVCGDDSLAVLVSESIPTYPVNISWCGMSGMSGEPIPWVIPLVSCNEALLFCEVMSQSVAIALGWEDGKRLTYPILPTPCYRNVSPSLRILTSGKLSVGLDPLSSTIAWSFGHNQTLNAARHLTQMIMMAIAIERTEK